MSKRPKAIDGACARGVGSRQGPLHRSTAPPLHRSSQVYVFGVYRDGRRRKAQFRQPDGMDGRQFGRVAWHQLGVR